MAELTNKYPSWVEKYRQPGVTIRKKNKAYGLYKCTSTYVDKDSYPKVKQEFLGMVYKDKGFVPKTKKKVMPKYLEYGLSMFIMLNFKRELKRVAYDGNMHIVKLGIIEYVFNTYNDALLSSCYLTYQDKELFDYLDKANPKRINTIKTNIISLLKAKVSDENDLNILIALLSLAVYDVNNDILPNKEETLLSLIRKYDLKIW